MIECFSCKAYTLDKRNIFAHLYVCKNLHQYLKYLIDTNKLKEAIGILEGIILHFINKSKYFPVNRHCKTISNLCLTLVKVYHLSQTQTAFFSTEFLLGFAYNLTKDLKIIFFMAKHQLNTDILNKVADVMDFMGNPEGKIRLIHKNIKNITNEQVKYIKSHENNKLVKKMFK